MTTPPVGVYGVVGGSASLSCIASGAPTPGLFTWFRDGVEVDVENTVTSPSETSAKSEVSPGDHFPGSSFQIEILAFFLR